jgi:endonuclease G
MIDILRHKSYIGAYNRVSRNPYWVAEHLTKDTLDGNIKRKHLKFRENSEIPTKFRSHLNDYVKSGFDRGHLVPAADVATSKSDLAETFLLSNCSPQNVNFNRGYWAAFEKKIRSLTKSYSDVYILTGPLFIPHQEEDGYYVKYKVIGDPPNTAVPTHFFKGTFIF